VGSTGRGYTPRTTPDWRQGVAEHPPSGSDQEEGIPLGARLRQDSLGVLVRERYGLILLLIFPGHVLSGFDTGK
jgi:hypothetical protein